MAMKGQQCKPVDVREDAYLNVTIMTGLPASILFWTKAPPSCSQLAPEPRDQPLTTFMTSDQVGKSETIHKPVNPDHDRQTRILVYMGRACDVEIQTLKLVLGQELFGEFALDDSEQLALKADISQLRANRAVTDRSGTAREGQIGVCTHPCVVASV
jgi:hypothetical protein